MNPFDYFFSGFVIFGTLLALLLAILLWPNPGKHLGNRYLSVCLAISAFTYSVYGTLYVIQSLAEDYSLLFYLPLTLELLILPFCYLYICSIYQSPQTHNINSIKQAVHFVPCLVGFLILLPIFHSTELQQQAIQEWFSGEYVQQINVPILLIGLILLGQLIVYLALIIHKHIQYQQFIQAIFSDIEAIRLRWVRGIIVIWAIYLVIHLFLFIYPMLMQTQPITWFVYLFILTNVLFYIYIAIQALQHPKLFDKHQIAEANQFTAENTKQSKYARSPLPQDKAQQIQLQLINHLENEKAYIDSNLTINKLAQQLSLSSSKQLSQVLNEVMKESFYQLINRYRVEEAKLLLVEKPHLSVIDVAYESGFKSSSSFYNHFKNQTGMTPNAYQKSVV